MVKNIDEVVLIFILSSTTIGKVVNLIDSREVGLKLGYNYFQKENTVAVECSFTSLTTQMILCSRVPSSSGKPQMGVMSPACSPSGSFVFHPVPRMSSSPQTLLEE